MMVLNIIFKQHLSGKFMAQQGRGTEKDDCSAHFSKYLTGIIYNGASYYTVSGADSTDQEADKLLVDTNEQLLLFSDREHLIRAILNTNHFFDIELLHAWARESHDIENAYTVIDLDVLSLRDIHVTQTDLLKSVYITIGIVEDYAYQTNNRALISLLESDIVRLHYDIFADYFLWSPQTPFDFVTLPAGFSDAVNDMYRILQSRVIIM
jgi:hypothetical protein